MDEKRKGKTEKVARKKESRTAPKKAKAPAKGAAARREPAPSKPAASAVPGEPAGVVARAQLRHVRISHRKARLVVNMIKGQQVESALRMLRFSPRKASGLTEKLLRSAVANARERAGVDVDTLWVLGGKVDMGRTLKRWMPAAHGRAAPIRKRSAHITIYLGARG